MQIKRTWRALAGAFYLVVVLVPGLAPASVEPLGGPRWIVDESLIGRLETNLRTAYENPGRGLNAFQIFDHLKIIYAREHRLQDLAWLEMRYGDANAAIDLEHRLLGELAVDDIVSQSSFRKGYDLITFAGGSRAVVSDAEEADGTISHAAAVYEINRELGFDLVPVTTIRRIGGRNKVVQAFVPGIVTATVDLRVQPYENKKLWVLDYITRQMDRAPSTLGLRAGGYEVALTNDAVFDSYAARVAQASLDVKKRITPPSFATPSELPADVRAGMLRLKKALVEDPRVFERLTYEESADVFHRVAFSLRTPADCGHWLR